MIVQKILILIYHIFYASSHGGKGEQAPWTHFIGVLIPKHFQRTLPISTPMLETVSVFSSGGITNIQTIPSTVYGTSTPPSLVKKILSWDWKLSSVGKKTQEDLSLIPRTNFKKLCVAM